MDMLFLFKNKYHYTYLNEHKRVGNQILWAVCVCYRRTKSIVLCMCSGKYKDIYF